MKFANAGQYSRLFLIATWLALFMASTRSGAVVGQRVREIEEKPGAPLEARLLPDDEVVLVKRTQVHGVETIGHPTPTIAITNATAASDVVAVLLVDSVVGELTNDQSWIRTLVKSEISEIIMSRTPGLRAGQSLQIVYESGGETNIAQCLVRAGAPLNVVSGRRYLMFLNTNPRTGTWYLNRIPLAIDGGRLVDTWQSLHPEGEADPLAG